MYKSQYYIQISCGQFWDWMYWKCLRPKPPKHITAIIYIYISLILSFLTSKFLVVLRFKDFPLICYCKGKYVYIENKRKSSLQNNLKKVNMLPISLHCIAAYLQWLYTLVTYIYQPCCHTLVCKTLSFIFHRPYIMLIWCEILHIKVSFKIISGCCQKDFIHPCWSSVPCKFSSSSGTELLGSCMSIYEQKFTPCSQKRAAT